MKTAIHSSILHSKIPDVDLSKERTFFAYVRRSNGFSMVTVIRSYGPLSALTQSLSLNFIYVSQNVCGATPGIPININLNGGAGLKVSPKNAGSITSPCVSTLDWQRTLSTSVVF